MKLKTKVRTDSGLQEVEFEGTLGELENLPDNISKLRDCVKILTQN